MDQILLTSSQINLAQFDLITNKIQFDTDEWRFTQLSVDITRS